VGGLLRGWLRAARDAGVQGGLRANPNFYVYIVENVALGDPVRFELRVIAGEQSAATPVQHAGRHAHSLRGI